MCISDKWATVIESCESQNGYSVKVCDICQDIIDIKETKNCDEHSFGDPVVEKEPEGEESGLEYSECYICGHREYRVITSYIIKGDINGDEIVDMNDAISLLQHSMFPDIFPIC